PRSGPARRRSRSSARRCSTARPPTCGWRCGVPRPPLSCPTRSSCARRGPSEPGEGGRTRGRAGEAAGGAPSHTEGRRSRAESPWSRRGAPGVKVAIHQPHYLPWLGYLAKWAAADCFVFLDTVQYEKNGWQNRNRIKTKDGPQWLTVPVCRERDTLIRDVRIDTAQPWARRHLQAARLAYARAAHADLYGARLGALLERRWNALASLAIETAEFLAAAFAIRTP